MLRTLVLFLLLTVGDASAHARLVRSEPADAAIVAPAPAAIELWFDGALERRFHQLRLRGPDGAETPIEATVDADDAKHLRAPLPPLGAGRWEVRWDVVSRDGHRIAGVVGFVVK